MFSTTPVFDSIDRDTLMMGLSTRSIVLTGNIKNAQAVGRSGAYWQKELDKAEDLFNRLRKLGW